ncbi:MAG: hypothetical protein ACTSWL_03150, partial [Promethearchaeota archaeon]
GISFKQALRFAQTYFEMTEHISKNTVLCTEDICDIYDEIIEIISEYAQTEYTKQKLHLYFPLPSYKLDLIYERQNYFGKAANFVKKHSDTLQARDFLSLFKKLNSLKQAEDLPKIRSRIILTDSPKVEAFLREEELSTVATMEFIDLNKVTDFMRFFESYSKNFDVVIYCGNHSDRIPDFPNLMIVPVKDCSLVTLVPEQIIRVFAYNKTVIQAMIKIVIILKSLKENFLINSFLDTFDIKKIKTLKENTTILDDEGEILPEIDEKLDNLRSISDEYLSLVSETEHKINEEIQKEIGARSIKIQGKQILDLMRSDLDLERIRNYIPAEVDALVEETLQKGIVQLGEQLKLGRRDQDLLNSLVPEVVEYPIQLDSQAADELEKIISARLNVHKYSAMVKIASKLNETYTYLLKLHQVLLEFDFFYTIGQFANYYMLSIPKIIPDSYGFFGQDMMNLHLCHSELESKKKKKEFISKFDSAVPITYQLGKIIDSKKEHSLLNFTCTPLSLLTGSNSGGKTMCILTCSQALILAQMGFPSLGKLQFHPLDELYYYKKSSGQLSAGAFETTLLQFVDLAQSSHLKLVFADELESITEPNAASKVLAGIFALFLENPNNYGVFVTHLAEMLKNQMNSDQQKQLRIDGIEATGLDEELRLIVDRSPKFNFEAKSTPELILKRLAKSGNSEQQNFFESILSKFS